MTPTKGPAVPPDEDTKSDGQIAYEAYSLAVGGRSVHNIAMPTWDGQSDYLQAAWQEAADAVLNAPIPEPSKGSKK